jgi:type I restriction enzyme S subunit
MSLSQEFIREEDYDGWMVRGFPAIGDVLVTTEAPLGESAQVTDETIALAQRLILLKPDPVLMTGDFLSHYFRAGGGTGELRSRATGSTALGIKASHLRDVVLPVPPINEQQAIVGHVSREISGLERLTAKVRRHVELLGEYRTALISAAVTGKIDVREA